MMFANRPYGKRGRSGTTREGEGRSTDAPTGMLGGRRMT